MSLGDSVTSVTSYEGSLLWTLEEIGRLISESGDASETLANIVRLIQHRFETDLKRASDLGIPLVAVGLYYDEGYFRQRLDRDGWQHEDYIDVDHRQLPMQPAQHEGAPITIAIETRTGTIVARVWQLSVGRNILLLLDSNVEGNRPEDRELTARLYGGDERVRIRQELLLGVGGVRALAALDIVHGVLHLNEGHSAFATLELVRHRMATEGVDAEEAIRRVSPQVVFTTHTPVPAGHDCFPPTLIRRWSSTAA